MTCKNKAFIGIVLKTATKITNSLSIICVCNNVTHSRMNAAVNITKFVVLQSLYGKSNKTLEFLLKVYNFYVHK